MGDQTALADSVKELGQWLSKLTNGGKHNPQIAKVLERAREALRNEGKNT